MWTRENPKSVQSASSSCFVFFKHARCTVIPPWEEEQFKEILKSPKYHEIHADDANDECAESFCHHGMLIHIQPTCSALV